MWKSCTIKTHCDVVYTNIRFCTDASALKKA